MKLNIMLCSMAVGMLALGSACADGFTPPDEATLQALIQTPDAIGSLIEHASEEQAAMIIIQVIAMMQAEGMEMDAIHHAVAIMFQTTAEVRGAEFGAAVVARVRKKINPRLLPIIHMGGIAPPPPGPAPRYPNQ